MTKNFLLGLLVLAIFISCSASSNAQRYNKNKSKKPVENSRIPSDDSTKKVNGRTDRVAFSDLPDSLDDEEEFDEPPPAVGAPIDKAKLVAKIDKLNEFNIALTPREKILLQVIKFLDTPYKYGGSSEKGIDCSAFTLQVYRNSISSILPRSAREQYTVGEKIDREELQFGDLVFFNTRRRSNPGHVGIYLGENKFVHASRTLGVTVSSLDETYYKKRYVGARRVDPLTETD